MNLRNHEINRPCPHCKEETDWRLLICEHCRKELQTKAQRRAKRKLKEDHLLFDVIYTENNGDEEKTIADFKRVKCLLDISSVYSLLVPKAGRRGWNKRNHMDVLSLAFEQDF